MRHGESNQTNQHEQSANQKETAGDGEIGNQQAGHRAEKTDKYPDSTSPDWDPEQGHEQAPQYVERHVSPGAGTQYGVGQTVGDEFGRLAEIAQHGEDPGPLPRHWASDCPADQMGVPKIESLPPNVRQALEPLLKEVEPLTEKIQESDHEIEQIARRDYPETALLQQVSGVGPLIALTFVLTVEDKDRFQKTRDIRCYVGLRPRRCDSGQSQPQLRITKEGDPYLRTMLVEGAHYIISRRGPDTDLKRWACT
jgi:hypothetical protein